MMRCIAFALAVSAAAFAQDRPTDRKGNPKPPKDWQKGVTWLPCYLDGEKLAREEKRPIAFIIAGGDAQGRGC